MVNLDRRNFLKASVVAGGSMVLAGCGSTSSSTETGSTSSTAGSTATVDVTQLTVVPGTLTVGTGDPAYSPWVIDDDPESGEGFEAALIYDVAEKMGFSDDEVTWVRTAFDDTYAPGAKDWDMNIQQVDITDERAEAVDFSPAYYRSTQALIVPKDGPYADATSVADFADATIAVMVGSTAYDFAISIIKDGSTDGIEVYNDNSAAAQAVDAGQCDALMTDTVQTSWMIESDQIANATAFQVPGTESVEGFGIVLPKDSELTPYVAVAVNELLDDGTIDALEEEWLSEFTNIPMLSE